MITINIIKSIKSAVVENGVEVVKGNTVVWDVCTKSYKFYINDFPMYYTMPDGEQCLNYNYSIGIVDLMNMSDEEVLRDMNRHYQEHKEQLDCMVDYYNNCK